MPNIFRHTGAAVGMRGHETDVATWPREKPIQLSSMNVSPRADGATVGISGR